MKQGRATAEQGAKPADSIELLESIVTLKGYLQQLEKENSKLADELAEKRKQRIKREKEQAELRIITEQRLKKIDADIKTSAGVIDEHQSLLKDLQNFYEKNNVQLKELTERLDSQEESLPVTPGTLDGMQSELLVMLKEIESMRNRREKFMSDISNVNLTG